jgi:lipoprotein signal peptidase
MKWQRWQWVTFSLLILSDQLSKWWVSQAGLVTYNQGVSFGLFNQLPTFWLTLVLLVVAGLAAWWWYRAWPEAKLANVLFWGGAVSNLFDRLLFGAVRDFLPILIIPGTKNNLADWYITIGLGLLLWQLVKSSLTQPNQLKK